MWSQIAQKTMTSEVGREYHEQLQVEAFEKHHAVIRKEAVFISFYSAILHKSFNLIS
jgi:hypothetical protein